MTELDHIRSPRDLVDELHRRQGEMYAGGSIDAVVKLLSPDIVWHVLGKSLISGSHRGIAQVIEYFERRRQLVNNTMRMRPGQIIFEGDAVVQFVEGNAVLGGEEVSWQTIGHLPRQCRASLDSRGVARPP